MKNRWLPALLAVTALFAGFVLGMFVGRNTGHAPVQLQHAPEQTIQADSTAAEETTAPAVPDQSTSASEPVQTTEQTSPAASEPTAASTETQPQPTEGGLVNINTAGVDELTALPGIGPVLAQAIVDYRTANGSFSSVEELINVKGIGTKKLEAILDYATVGGDDA